MKTRVVALVVAWVVSLLGVGIWAQGGVGELDSQHRWSSRSLRPGDPIGPVITGAELGFQRVVDSPLANTQGAVVGHFVVRINGEWVPVSTPVTLMPVGE